jgi:large subunit ribosomal protein L17
MRSLARSLILHGQIETTEAKAKALRPFVEPLVTKAKKDDLATRRLVIARLGGDKHAVKKLFEELAPKYADRPGGYTRITKIHSNSMDARDNAIIEFV